MPRGAPVAPRLSGPAWAMLALALAACAGDPPRPVPLAEVQSRQIHACTERLIAVSRAAGDHISENPRAMCACVFKSLNRQDRTLARTHAASLGRNPAFDPLKDLTSRHVPTLQAECTSAWNTLAQYDLTPSSR